MVTTKQLAKYIDDWKTKEKMDVDAANEPELETEALAAKVEAREKGRLAILGVLHQALTVAAQLERVVDSAGIGESRLTFGILLLSYTLQRQAKTIYGVGNVITFDSCFLRARFLASGWCPDQIAAIEESFPLTY